MNDHPVERWHRIVETRDVSGLGDLLADDVAFISPVAHLPVIGKSLVATYLTAALDVFSDPSFRYVREIVDAADAMLEFETQIDQTTANGVDLLKWNGAGEIVEFKVLIRPLTAILLVRERMAIRLSAGGDERAGLLMPDIEQPDSPGSSSRPPSD